MTNMNYNINDETMMTKLTTNTGKTVYVHNKYLYENTPEDSRYAALPTRDELIGYIDGPTSYIYLPD
jgi:hypothetical protein